MSNSLRAQARRTRQSHKSKHQRDIMASQHFGEREEIRNAKIRGKGDKLLASLMKEV